FPGRQHRVQLVHGHIAALLRELDHFLDCIVGKVEQRPVGAVAFDFDLFLFLCRHALPSPTAPCSGLSYLSTARLSAGVRTFRLYAPCVKARLTLTSIAVLPLIHVLWSFCLRRPTRRI